MWLVMKPVSVSSLIAELFIRKKELPLSIISRRITLQPVHLLVTHGHLDHNFGNNTIHETFGLKPEVSAADESLMKNLKQQAEVFYQMQLDYDFPPVGHFFEENEVIRFGNHQFEIILTPGHSRGSVTFYCADEKVAFTGDTLFRGSIGRTDFKGGSMFQIINSLRFPAQLPDDVKSIAKDMDRQRASAKNSLIIRIWIDESSRKNHSWY